MKKRVILAALGVAGAALVSQPGAMAHDFTPSGLLEAGAGESGSRTASGYLERSGLMINDANYRGALDQLRRAVKEYPTESEQEKAMLEEALAGMYVPGSDSMERLEQYLEQYPATAAREKVLTAIGDVLYDRGEYANALGAYRRVSLGALDPLSGDTYLYHVAFCELRTGNTSRAREIYRGLEGSRYSNEALFYLGYIAYAEGNYTEAGKLLKSVRPDGMPTSMADYYLCQICYRKEEYGEAGRLATRLLGYGYGIEPEYYAEAERIAGESLYRSGKEAEGVGYLEKYVGHCAHPQLSALYILGVEDFRKGKYEEAIKRLAPVTADDSTIGQSAYLYIGQSYLKLDNNNAATVALEKACRMNYDKEVHEMALYNLAVARSQGGKVPFGNSVSLFEEFLQRYPDSKYASQVADYVVEGYMTDNNYQAAYDAIERIHKPDAKVLAAKQRVLYGLGMKELQSGHAAEASRHFKEASQMGKYSSALAAEATLWLGESLYQQGDYAGAVTAYNKYLNQKEGSAANRALAYYDLGYARFARKEFGDARADFAKFIARTPDKSNRSLMADAYNRLGDCQYYGRNFGEAAESYSKAYDQEPKRGDYPQFQKGLMKGLQRDYQGKIEALGEMMREFPSSALVPTALLETGEAYGELGRDDRAIETYTLLSNRYPNTRQGRQGQLLLAITYLNAGQRTTAINQYKKVISRYPTSEQAQVAAEDLKQIYAESGTVGDYVEFIQSVPDAPRPETSELAALTLGGAERALENGREADALAQASEVVEKYPDSPQATAAYGIKGEVQYQQGRSTEALESYRAMEERASGADELNSARLGVMRTSRDLGDYDTAISMADKLLSSSDLGSDAKNEVIFLKAMSLRDSNRGNEAVEEWSKLTGDLDDLNGTKSAYYMALYYYDNKNLKRAKSTVNKLIEANPPHDYWLAKGFILLSDILRKEGNSFEADEYLRSLKENYPGSEQDVFQDIEKRLK